MMKIHAALIALALVACVKGQEEVDITNTRQVTFPGIPAQTQIQAPAQAQSRGSPAAPATTDSIVTFDVHDGFAALRGMGPLTAAFSTHTLSGADLGNVTHVRAVIRTTDAVMPERLLSETDVVSGSSEVALPLAMTDSEILAYLMEGPVDVHFYLKGTLPTQPITLTHTLGGRLTVAVDGPLAKF